MYTKINANLCEFVDKHMKMKLLPGDVASIKGSKLQMIISIGINQEQTEKDSCLVYSDTECDLGFLMIPLSKGEISDAIIIDTLLLTTIYKC